MARPESDPVAVKGRAAIRRCETAWRRCFDVYMEAVAKDKEAAKNEEAGKGEEVKEDTDVFERLDALLEGHEDVFAAHEANEAYCRAMPVLAGYESIRNFMACLANGILIGAIPENRAGHLLYAVQVALSIAGQERKTRSVGSA